MARKRAEPGNGDRTPPATGETAREETAVWGAETSPHSVAAAPEHPAAELPEGPEKPLSDLPETSAAEPVAAQEPGSESEAKPELEPASDPAPLAEPFDMAVAPADEPEPRHEAQAVPQAVTFDEPAAQDAAEPAADGPAPDHSVPTEPVEPAHPWFRSPDEPVETPAASAAAPAAAPVAASVEEEVVEEERGGSFAGKALAALVLLGLGAAGGIWAAPRIAPMLPAGMAPVAAWLTPGGSEAEARLAALDTRLEGEISALQGQVQGLPTADALRGEAQTLVGQTRDSLTGEIAALRDRLDQVGDPGARFGQIESSLSGVGAELAALKGQIESGAAAAGAGAAAGIDTYRAELEGLRAEVGRLSGAVESLNGRLDRAESDAETRAATAEATAAAAQEEATASVNVAAARAGLAQIGAALVSGAPFQAELDAFARDTGAAIPAGLTAAAAGGVATETELEARFPEAAHAAIRASIVASSGTGMWDRTRAFVEAQMASRSLSPQEGSAPDAVLSRVEAALKRDDLAAALAEAGTLPSESREAMASWLAAAQARADAEAGLAELSAAPNLN